MTASELRIGNWIEYNGMVCQVYSIQSPLPRKEERYNNKEIITLLCGGLISVTIEECNPVSTTEEVLLNFGFLKVNDYYITIESFHYENKNCWIYLFKKVFEFHLITSDGRFNLHRSFKYVHQLQNLYFALIGKELELKTT